MRAIAALSIIAIAAAQPVQATDALVRVVDVGNGLCVVARTTEGRSMVYDGGQGGHCARAVGELIPEDRVDLMILSHSDADHISDAAEIITRKTPRLIIHPGDARQNTTILNTRAAIDIAGQKGSTVWNLAIEPLADSPASASARRTISLGSAKVTIISGWSNADGLVRPGQHLGDAERNNAISVVARLELGSQSILLTGDAVGRLALDPAGTCAYSERSMVDNAARWPIRSDVLVGQHHGADNASSECLIAAVKPAYVVFSAGHKGYRHPRNAAVRRFLQANISPDSLFRTDRGDNEPDAHQKPWSEQEWIYGSIKGCKDKPGDDDVEIRMSSEPGKRLTVSYASLNPGC